MYLLDHEIERDCLRQGDIVSQVPIIGALNIQAINYSQDARGNETGWHFNNPMARTSAMVISHSCEIDPSNGVKLTSVILAPLRDVDKASRPEHVQLIRESNLVTPDTQASFLKYFFVEPNDHLEFRNGAVVDFSKCFSVRNQAYGFLVENKVLQLTSEIQSAMALKLALFFYRKERAA